MRSTTRATAQRTARRNGLGGLVALAASGAALVGSCATDGRTLRPARPDQNASVSTIAGSTTLPAVVDGGVLDDPLDDPLDGGSSGIDADGDGIVDSTFATLPAGQTVPPTTAAAAMSTGATAPTDTADIAVVDQPAGSADIPAGPGEAIGGDEAVLVGPFAQGAPIDPRHTCLGEGVSPALSWTAAPVGTVEVALTLTDTDAPGVVHWAMAGIDPGVTSLAEGEVPDGAIVAIGSSGVEGYAGPCPPQGAPAHRYVFTVHFLAQQTELQSGAAGEDLVAAIQGATFGGASLVGTFANG